MSEISTTGPTAARLIGLSADSLWEGVFFAFLIGGTTLRPLEVRFEEEVLPSRTEGRVVRVETPGLFPPTFDDFLPLDGALSPLKPLSGRHFDCGWVDLTASKANKGAFAVSSFHSGVFLAIQM